MHVKEEAGVKSRRKRERERGTGASDEGWRFGTSFDAGCKFRSCSLVVYLDVGGSGDEGGPQRRE